MYKRPLIALASFVSITSCGTTALSRNEVTGVDTGQKALLRTYNQPVLSGMILGDQPVTKIISAEGMNKNDIELLKFNKAIAVDVGLNKVIVGCSSRAKDDEQNFTEIIQINFKPYHEYSVRCSFDSGKGSGGSYVARVSVEENRLK